MRRCSYPFFAPLLSLIWFCASCASEPHSIKKPSHSGLETKYLLPAGADIFLYIDKARDPSFYEALTSSDSFKTAAARANMPDNKTMKKLLDATHKIMLGLYPNGETREMAIQLRGRGYPVLRGAWAFTLNRDWQKAAPKKGKRYWQSKKSGTAVILQSQSVLLASSPALFENGNTVIPLSFQQLAARASAGGILSSRLPLNAFFERVGIPFSIPSQDLFFVIQPHQFGYETVVRFDMGSSTAARGAAALFTLLRNNYRREDLLPELRAVTDAFLANPVIRDGSALIITTAPLDAEVYALFLSFIF